MTDHNIPHFHLNQLEFNSCCSLDNYSNLSHFHQDTMEFWYHYSLDYYSKQSMRLYLARAEAGAPRMNFEIDRIVIRDVQYEFEVNRCRNEEVNLQSSSAYNVGGDSGQDGWTDRRQR
ncbi:hypothetical protein DPMN_064161 [Dreissena polymorpha]|uniref:Uncharacterized protein n=1 Tax=Dreissena polymorpha TaxID=45954 RepID=A0A9D4CBT0_DREPO|nr:hypothetical protein DPMN_064161 [Dreissena polymorpha]